MNNKNEEDFFDKYTCIDNPFTENGEYDNKMYETYDEELVAVLIAAEYSPQTVWTLIDDNDEWFGVVAGYHRVNRIGYFITEENWEDINEEYEL